MNSEPSSSSLKRKYDTFSDSAPSAGCQRKYDVFLSFRGEDTRKGFVSHLYDALVHRGVYTYKDDVRLEKGTTIAPELVKAIEESRSAIVVLSRNYASSTWCLEELCHILKCFQERDNNYKVFPVFYDVEPTDVRKLTGDFREGFDKNGEVIKGNKTKIEEWRKDLNEIADLSGWELKDHETEAELIKIIVKDVSAAVSPNIDLSIVSQDYVGMDVRLEEVNQLLDLSSDGVRTIGIWGMGGIGKTTIAQLMFEQFKNMFEASCFVQNVRETLLRNGSSYLQEYLLKCLLGSSEIIQSSINGRITLMGRLGGRRVLIVLDDVNELQEIEDLIGKGDIRHFCFREGSRIIVTTRDKHLLKTIEVDGIYEGTDAVELIGCSGYQPLSNPLRWTVDSLLKMPNLKCLISQYTSIEFLTYKCDDEPRRSSMVLKKLVVVDLTGSKFICNSIDFSIIPNLQRLYLCSCRNLRELDQSIGSLKQLIYLDLIGSDIECLPSNIGNLSNLKELHLRSCRGLQLPNSLLGLCSLVILDLSECGLGDGEIPYDIGSLSSLKELYLSRNDFTSIPESISQLFQLIRLDLKYCYNLVCLPKHLPLSLEIINTEKSGLLARYLPIWNLDNREQVPLMRCRISEDEYKIPRNKGYLKCFSISESEGMLLKIIWSLEIPESCVKTENIPKGPESCVKTENILKGYTYELCVVYEVFGLDDGYSTLESTHVRKDFLCYFNTDQGSLKHPLEFDLLISKRVGLYVLLMFIPGKWFGDQLNGASFLQASLDSINGSHVRLKGCNGQFMSDRSTFFYEFSNMLESHNPDLVMCNHALTWIGSPHFVSYFSGPFD